MASDRGQNRQSDFVASESLIVVVFLSSWRDLSLFVSSSFPVSSHCFLRVVKFLDSSYCFLRGVVVCFVSSFCFLRGVIRLFASSCSSFRRRRYKQVCGNSILPGRYLIFCNCYFPNKKAANGWRFLNSLFEFGVEI